MRPDGRRSPDSARGSTVHFPACANSVNSATVTSRCAMKNAGRSTLPSPADGDHFSLSNASGSVARSAPMVNGPAGISTNARDLGLGAWGLGLRPGDCQQAADGKSAVQLQVPSPKPLINSPPSRTQTPSHACTRAAYSSGSGISSRFGPPSRNSNRKSIGRGSMRLGVDASSMLTQPAWKRPSQARAKYANARSGSCVDDPPFDVVAAELVAGPAGVVAAVRRFDAHQPLRTPAAAARRTPAPRTAASRRDACHRRRRPSSSTRRTRSTPPCARGCRGRAGRRAQRVQNRRLADRAHEAIDRRRREVQQRHAQQLVVERRHARARRESRRARTRQGRRGRRRSAGRTACAARSTDR